MGSDDRGRGSLFSKGEDGKPVFILDADDPAIPKKYAFVPMADPVSGLPGCGSASADL